MAVLVPEQSGPLEDVASFRHLFGGAESNVARGLAALGEPAAWLSRVGDDGLGRNIVRGLAADGVDVSAVETDGDRPTGLYLKESGPQGTRMHYYRRGSAASAMGPELLDVPAVRALLDSAAVVHTSGITAALSDSALAMVEQLLAQERGGRTVSFDLNWRPALWHGRDAAAVLRPLLNRADVVLCGADEAEAVFGTGEPGKLRALLPDPAVLIVKDEANTATAVERDGTATAQSALRVEVVEPVGAGDAFAAGYLAGTLRGLPQAQRLRLGHLTAAATLVVPGDHGAPLPAAEADALLAAGDAEWAAATVSAAPDGGAAVARAGG